MSIENNDYIYDIFLDVISMSRSNIHVVVFENICHRKQNVTSIILLEITTIWPWTLKVICYAIMSYLHACFSNADFQTMCGIYDISLDFTRIKYLLIKNEKNTFIFVLVVSSRCVTLNRHTHYFTKLIVIICIFNKLVITFSWFPADFTNYLYVNVSGNII